MTNSLQIKNLHVKTVDNKEILKGINLTLKPGEIHVIMGPNGGGKSTLSQVLMGHPGYLLTAGSIILDGHDISTLSPDKRATLGLFLGFQYPVEVAGVNFAGFLRLALNTKNSSSVSPIAFRKLLGTESAKLSFTDDISSRSLNEGFSGGEKKKSEILQLAVLKPKYAILDEPDSGLDIDALKYISKAITTIDPKPGLLLITHYQRLLQYIKPDFVHILIHGKIVESGTSLLVNQIEKSGYEHYQK